jgi:transcription-repair coupling factor (superfamily II helicase)
MPEHQLEDTMREFVQHRGDILVCTTIIESGLDIPRANTIFINDADRFGLADIHQLRGRVGRYKHRAYAYLLVDAARRLTQDAAKRLKAIEEFSDLGAGFRIALRDLEIRGAGNILGAQQSGHIAAVGYELYCQLLENAVRQLKKQPLRTRLDVAIELPWRVFLPRDYVPGLRQKIELYRRLARIHELDEVAQLRQELTDRFGPPPPSVANMLATCELRILAQRWQIGRIRYDGQYLVLEYRDATAIAQLVQRSRQDLRVADATSAYLPAGAGTDGPQLADRLKQLLGDDHVPQGPPRGAGHRGAARAGRGAHRR